MRARILTDPMPRLLWRLSLPSIAGLLLVGINQLIDGIFVGQFVGEAGLGGVSLALPITQVTLGLGAMIGSGAGSILSRAIGSDNKLLQSSIIPAMNSVALLLSVVVALVGVPNAAAIIRLMGGTGELVELGSEYLRIMAAGALFPIWGLGSNLLIRAEGRMVAAMVRTSITVIANTVLNYLFMGILGWGMSGAALATVLAMALFCLTGLSYFSSSKPSFQTRVAALSFDRTLIREILSVGAPSLVLQVMGLVQQLVTYRLLAFHGGAGDIAFFWGGAPPVLCCPFASKRVCSGLTTGCGNKLWCWKLPASSLCSRGVPHCECGPVTVAVDCAEYIALPLSLHHVART